MKIERYEDKIIVFVFLAPLDNWYESLDYYTTIEVASDETLVLDLGELSGTRYGTEDTIALIESLQTAVKIQGMVARGEPVVIVNGRLIEGMPKTIIEWRTLGLTACLDKHQESFTSLPVLDFDRYAQRDDVLSRDGFAPIFASVKLKSSGLINEDFTMTDLGWQVLKVGK